ncbi:MAG: hypothetical protein ABIJ48_03855 [Actinomycetota bacterium]
MPTGRREHPGGDGKLLQLVGENRIDAFRCPTLERLPAAGPRVVSRRRSFFVIFPFAVAVAE